MLLVVDANVLVRMVVGRMAAGQAKAAIDRGAALLTTVAQLDEAAGVLHGKFDFEPEEIVAELLAATDVMSVTDLEGYQWQEVEARERLPGHAGKDWHVLATALAFDGSIWSDDRDFFGTGVAVWSSVNIGRAAPAASAG